MANKEINVRLKNRRDALANWEAENPVLLNGETAYVVLDGGVRQKTGDGTKKFKELPYDDADIYQAVSALQTSQSQTASSLSALDSEVDTLSADVATANSNASTALSKLDGKADASTVSSLQSTVNTLSSSNATTQAEVDALENTVAGHTTSIASLQQAPPSHAHAMSDVTGLDATIEGLETDIASAASTAATALATANNKAPSDHTHTPASIGAAPSDHPHSISDMTDLQDALDGKANASTVSSHTANTTVHLTAAERTNWNAAYTHSTAAHAPSGAEVNQNAFSNVKVGSVTIAADSKTDTLTIAAGSNIQLAGDATNDVVTISATDTTYGAATTSANGLMTAAMVTKLNGIAAGANAYSLPTASSSTLGGVKTTSTVTSASGYTACPIIGGVPYYKDTDTTYSLGSFGITATATELNYMEGVTSNVQTQLNGKAPTYELSALRARVDSVSSQAAAAYSKANSAYALVDSKADVNHTHNDLKPFVATYGVTKFSDILAAHNAGQIVMMTSLNTSSYLASSSASAAVIGNVSSNSATFDFAFVDNFGRAVRVTNKVDSNNTWSNLYMATPSINRTTNLHESDTNYTTLMARGTSLNASDTTPAVNGAIAWTYE